MGRWGTGCLGNMAQQARQSSGWRQSRRCVLDVTRAARAWVRGWGACEPTDNGLSQREGRGGSSRACGSVMTIAMSDIRDRLSRTEALAGEPASVDDAARIFDFVQFLLDDDEHLTPTGNLNGVAKAKLRARIAELVDPREVAAAEDVGA